VRPPPKLTVRFWPPSVTAEGVPAITAIRRPLAFAMYVRPVVAIVMGLFLLWGGNRYVGPALNYLKALF
jgi:hypothetical protein